MTLTFALYDRHPRDGGRVLSTDTNSLTLRWDADEERFTISPHMRLRFHLPASTPDHRVTPTLMGLHRGLDLILLIPLTDEAVEMMSGSPVGEPSTLLYDWTLHVSTPDNAVPL